MKSQWNSKPVLAAASAIAALLLLLMLVVVIGLSTGKILLALLGALIVFALFSTAAMSVIWSVRVLKKTFDLTKNIERKVRETSVKLQLLSSDVSVMKPAISDIAGEFAEIVSPIQDSRRSNQQQEISMKKSLPNIKNSSHSLLGLSRDTNAPRGLKPAIAEINDSLEQAEIIERFVEEDVEFVIKNDPSTVYWEVSDEGYSFEIKVESGDAASIELASVSLSVGPDAQKSSLLCARAFDKGGQPLEHKVLRTVHEKYGSFSYIHAVTLGNQVFPLSIPSTAVKIILTIRPWKEKQALKNRVICRKRSTNPRWAEQRNAKQVKVAVILDEFSYNSFSPEFSAIVITPENWRITLENERPDLFFCESAWSGVDSKVRPWKGKVYASENFRQENRSILLEILTYCRENGIPTVFWNKEDPTHYEDRTHDFVKTAILFDHVFTTDEKSADRYRQEYGHVSVHTLPFAVQPALFNPVETENRSDEVIFAGSWYQNHEKRSQDMQIMFDAVLDSGLSLKIYDRYFNDEDNLHEFPGKYKTFIKPPVAHDQVASVYKESNIGITINTVTGSPTMFARRIFELMACNTLVISNYSLGVDELFGNDVVFLDRDPKALESLDPEAISQIRERNLSRVLKNHTYKHRFANILEVAGIKYNIQTSDPTIVIRITHIDQAKTAWENLRAINCQVQSRVLLVSHDIHPLDVTLIVQTWNTNGIKVINERSLIDGAISSAEAFGGTEFIYLTSDTDSCAMESDFDRLILHASYANSPVCLGPTEQRYRFSDVKHLPSGVYQTKTIKDTLNVFLHTGKTLIYSV